MHAYIHTYIHAYIHTYIHTYIPAFPHTGVDARRARRLPADKRVGEERTGAQRTEVLSGLRHNLSEQTKDDAACKAAQNSTSQHSGALRIQQG
jgi:hypothetical protein